MLGVDREAEADEQAGSAASNRRRLSLSASMIHGSTALTSAGAGGFDPPAAHVETKANGCGSQSVDDAHTLRRQQSPRRSNQGHRRLTSTVSDSSLARR